MDSPRSTARRWLLWTALAVAIYAGGVLLLTAATPGLLAGGASGHRHDGYDHGQAHDLQAYDRAGLGAHEASEGPQLVGDAGPHDEVLFQAAGCPAAAPVKQYRVVATPVVMVLNRWGDRDPEAFIFTLEERLPEVRAQLALADSEGEHYGLSLGLGADAIQPLAIRANVGDCVRITFRNALERAASFHIHGADLVLAVSGEPALSTNPAATAMPGETLEYLWYVSSGYYQENTHYLHAHGPYERYLVGHGLFGALIVEPPGSSYFDMRSGAPLCREADGVTRCLNSWDAIISPGDGSADFREFAMFYHEIGNARFSAVDADGVPNPNIDPIVHSYKPNGRAINYRSESFFRRMGESLSAVGLADESQAYGSYAFGDPAMPVPQSYLGDPVKFRLIHGGSETFHVPHLHGGGIQWQRQQDLGKDAADYTPIDAGLKKTFAPSMPSAGNDSQTIGPSETYELEIGCGSGGCQQTVGDFLFHCHVASHYISGMWHFWRVYNTLQQGAGKTDELAVVAELPDRAGRVAAAVTSDALLGHEVAFAGRQLVLDEQNLAQVIEPQLPPRGQPRDLLDAAVFDWARQGARYLNAPESELSWPNFRSSAPGERLPLRFDPATAKLAWPFLRPHLGQRPPFAPNHGPAPYLEPLAGSRGEPATPGSNGPDSLCPAGAPRRSYKIHAIQTPLPVTRERVDANGMIFVLKEHEAQARSDPEFQVPLAIRANQGDCVDVVLINELEQTGEAAELSKTNIHIHFVQFDVQASDGVISGAAYEQSPRPFADPGMSAALQQDAVVGAQSVLLDDASPFHVGSVVAVGIDAATEIFETAVVAAVEGNRLVFAEPLTRPHRAGERVSVEFVRYRWYVGRQNGAIYFHDHVDALNRWGHGLFGALIAEPRGASYHHPVTGEEIRSGPMADIRVTGEVLPGLEGSFREFVLFMTDNNPITGSAFNLRAEPLFADTARGRGPPELLFSSVMHGDPFTPLLRAYVGDPVMLRLLTSATEEVHPFHITGHTFRQERFQPDGPALTVFGVGISERFNAYLAAAGGAAGQAGDYLYYNGAERHFREGSWGILRVHDTLQPDLQPLPGRTPPSGPGFPQLGVTGRPPPPAAGPGDPCPADAPRRSFAISAVAAPLAFNEAAGLGLAEGRFYLLDEDLDEELVALQRGEKTPVPLVLRANAGDCIEVQFTNRLADRHASWHLDALALDPQGSLGITVGFDPRQTAAPGETIRYRYFAERELGVVLARDFADPRNARAGLYGALVIEPAGSSYLDPYSGEPLASGVSAMIVRADAPDFRENVLLFHDSDPDIGLFVMPYDEDVNRLVGVNYRAEPLSVRSARFGLVRDSDRLVAAEREIGSLLASSVFGEPATNVFEAAVGDPIRFRVVSAYSEQSQVFHLEGHQWPLTPQLPGSDLLSARYLPPTAVLNVEVAAGGAAARAGDYLWGNHRLPFEKAGQWGLLRLYLPDRMAGLQPLPDRVGDREERLADREPSAGGAP